MVNSNVPRHSKLAFELHRNYLFKFKLVLSSVQSNTHIMAPLNVWKDLYKLVPFQLQQPKLWNRTVSIRFERWLQQCFRKIKLVPYFRVNNLRIFFQNLCHFIHIWAVSLIYSALQWKVATFRKVLVPFSFSRDQFLFPFYISFLIFPFLSRFFFF